MMGSKIINIDYGAGDPRDTLIDAGDGKDAAKFMDGSVLRSTGDAVIEIHNAALGTMIKLDWSDPANPIRISEDGQVEQGGPGHEMWVDFSTMSPGPGDFYQPFKTIADAAAAVAEGGTLKIMPGTTQAPGLFHNGKSMRFVAPIGGVTISLH